MSAWWNRPLRVGGRGRFASPLTCSGPPHLRRLGYWGRANYWIVRRPRSSTGNRWGTARGRIPPGSTPHMTGDFSLPPGDMPQGVASGSDGVIRSSVTTYQHNGQQIGLGRIGRIAPSGQITYAFVPGY